MSNIGFNVGTVAAPKYVCPDRGYNISSTWDTLSSDFGDGYSFRVKRAILNQKDVIKVEFKNRTKEEINEIFLFFRRYRERPFPFLRPSFSTSKLVATKCLDYTIDYHTFDTHTLTAILEVVNEVPLFIDIKPYVDTGYLNSGYVGAS